MISLKTVALVVSMGVGVAIPQRSVLAQEEEEPPLERECFTNTVSRQGVAWSDSTGSGRAVATFGHVGCRDPFCTRARSVWPYIFNGFGGKWIWKKQVISVAEAEAGDRVSFFDQYCRPRACGAVTAVSLLISADNAYEVHYVDASRNRTSGPLALDDEWRTVDGHSLPGPDDPEFVCQGFEIEVVNFAIPGGDGNVNPAGVSYDLRVQYERPETP